MRAIIIFLVGLSLSGCALTEATTDIDYKSQASASIIPGAESVAVSVAVTDSRSTNRDRVSVKKNGYGMEMAAIKSSRPVTDIVTGAVEQALVARGFKIAPGAVEVRVELVRFWNDYKTGFFGGKAYADVLLNVQVRNVAGRPIHIRSYNGEGVVEAVANMGGDNAGEALSGALTSVIDSLVSDPAFLQSLKDAGKSAGT